MDKVEKRKGKGVKRKDKWNYKGERMEGKK